MSSIWCVKPEERTIDLQYTAPDGTVHPLWIKVKKYLTVGEERRVMTAGFKGMSSSRATPGEAAQTEIQIDWRAQTFARTEAYLLEWSLTKDAVPTTREGIESLDPDVYALIEDAVTKHREEMDAAKKPTPGGRNEPAATSR